MIIEQKIEEMLHFLNQEKRKCNEELRQLPEGNLIATKRHGKTVYFNALSTEDVYKRVCITKNEEAQRGLARKKYVELQLKEIEREMSILFDTKTKLSGPVGEPYKNVLDRLPKAYSTLPKEFFFKEQVDDWGSQPYQQSTYKPEKRIHTTSRGLKVRSKSELLIAEKLYEHGIPFRYEQILWYGATEFAPDFTIRTADGRIIYWEHCGMTHDERYINHHKWKMSIYEKMDIVPWKNLIVTYDDEEGIISIPLIESEIINKLKS